MRKKDEFDDFADEVIHVDGKVRRALLNMNDGELAFALADAMRERFGKQIEDLKAELNDRPNALSFQ